LGRKIPFVRAGTGLSGGSEVQETRAGNPRIPLKNGVAI